MNLNELPRALPRGSSLSFLSEIKVWLKDTGYFIIDTTNNKVVRYRRKWKKEDLEKFMTQEDFIIEDRINYVDVTSNKE